MMSDASTFIQWKGTSVCLDLRCPCGTLNHYDADFCYFVRCSGCGVVYELGTSVSVGVVAEVPYGVDPKESVL